jgi:hypothetical protein|tara:strand:+ start:213 stop:902 length:690 start_codon:yes stop_codon:yes gene_type:complete
MSLKLINQSSNRKTGAIATTYRAGCSMYKTCPASCSLNPDGDNSATEIDQDYLTALRKAVPKKGVAWTYSHFDFNKIPQNEENKTVINYSADTVVQALNSFNSGRETTYTAPHTMTDKVDDIQGVRFIKCPAEENKNLQCQNCGNGRPLCARIDRDYVIKFVAHGCQKKKVGQEEKGGCYAGTGYTFFSWKATAKQKQEMTDAVKLSEWVKTLPYGTMLRHHVAGDIGK